VIRDINTQGTAVVLVEQNAAMALEVADTAYLLEVGTVALSGSSEELSESDEVRERYLGVGAGRQATNGSGPATSSGGNGAGAPPRDPRALSVDDVTVRFGGLSALEDVSFEVEPRSVHALIGPNGAGKSTCLNLLTGVYAPSSGRVLYGDDNLTALRPHRIARLGISRTFQNLALSPAASVAENLLLGRHRLTQAGFLTAGLRLPRARRERDQQRERVGEIAELLGLRDYFDRPVSDLSYGDRKRVELGRALAAEPALLLLDEPVAGMNAEESERMASTIADVRHALGISIVLVEHDMSFVMGLADRVTVLDFGRCIADGAPREVQKDPEVLRAYLGSSEEEATS
jgi:branched-chain amino acid transport system ATP-binding protein